MVSTLIEALDIYFSITSEEEFVELTKAAVEKVADKLSKEDRRQLLDKLVGNFKAYASEMSEELCCSLEYKEAIVNSDIVKKKYLEGLSTKEAMEFEDKYCAPLYLEESEMYKKGVIDGITKYSFLSKLINDN